MAGKRKRYSADFKAKVALAALRGKQTTAPLATKHGIHQTMVREWKKQAMEGLPAVFSGRSEAEQTAKSTEAEVKKPHSTNPRERFNAVIKRRNEAVGFFSNEDAVVRRIGVLLLEQNDKWAELAKVPSATPMECQRRGASAPAA